MTLPSLCCVDNRITSFSKQFYLNYSGQYGMGSQDYGEGGRETEREGGRETERESTIETHAYWFQVNLAGSFVMVALEHTHTHTHTRTHARTHAHTHAHTHTHTQKHTYTYKR